MRFIYAYGISTVIASTFFLSACADEELARAPAAVQATVQVDWQRVEAVSRAKVSLQVVPNSLFRRDSKLHAPIFRALRELAAEEVRVVHWYPQPRFAVAQLEPPRDGQAFWDFTLIDPLLVDVMNAMEGRSVMMNFSTIPQWMFLTEKPVVVPTDPNEVYWGYTQGTELRDSSLKELADYYVRLVSWYTGGGFTDEAGKRHESPHRYEFEWWEVFNEANGEHLTKPEQYTARYDAIVSALRTVAPRMKFAGPALAFPAQSLPFFEHFLDPAKHASGVPLDALTYHFYSLQRVEETAGACPSQMFSQTDEFLAGVSEIEAIRARFRPDLPTHINEIGALDSDEFLGQTQPGFKNKAIDPRWWNASAAVFAYQYGRLAAAGIEVVGQSALAQYPGLFPSVSMLDWETGKPNARFRVLKLIRESFGPGDSMLATTVDDPGVYAQAFATSDGRRRLLLVNKCDRAIDITSPDLRDATAMIVDQNTAFGPPREEKLDGDPRFQLGGYGIAVSILP
jgi:hypothetical protein